MTEISRRDQRAAEAWMVKMLDDPVRHGPAFDKWASAKAGRLEYYESLLGSIQKASRAARTIRVERPARTAHVRFGSRALAAGAAAVIISLLLVTGWHFYSKSLGGEEPGQIASPLETKVGEVRTEELADGSTVILDTNSEITADLRDVVRNIELKRGRARFTVARDKSRPFIVSAGGYKVIATGTIFDVTLRGGFGVHLLEGAVEVQPANGFAGSGTRPTLKLRPGQKFSIFDGQTGISSAMPARPSDEQWVNGVKSFDDVPIKDVIAEANSYQATQIVLADPSLGDREIFGDINIRDTEAVVHAIASYLNLRIDRSQPGRLILVSEK